MPFPTDDRAWNDTLLYLLERRRPGERTLAPDEFADELPFVRPYSQRDGRDEPSYAWAVVHKGMTDTLGAAFLRSLPGWAVPVFANDVFVVFAREPGFAMTDLSDSDHVKSLFASLPDGEAAAPAEPPAAASEPAAASAATAGVLVTNSPVMSSRLYPPSVTVRETMRVVGAAIFSTTASGSSGAKRYSTTEPMTRGSSEPSGCLSTSV